MIKNEVRVYKDTGSLSYGFTQFILDEVIDKKQKVNISLSGGATPRDVFDYWSKECQEQLPWDKMSFFWGDERCLPPKDEKSNFGMAKTHLFDHINMPSNNIFRIHGENQPEQEAIRYSEVLRKNLPIKNKTPYFDLIILGLGEDGHTVSIFPDQIELWDSPNICTMSRQPETNLPRITVTGKIINNSEKVVFLVTGETKSKIVQAIIQNRDLFTDKYPAAKASPVNQKIYWFLDKEAAKLL